MSVILTFLPEAARLYTSTLAGIRRRLGSECELKIVDYRVDAPTLRKLIDFWKPTGCIMASWIGIGDSIVHAFGKTPVVYLDRSPLAKGRFLDVVQDYEENGQIAARELIQTDVENYAFVGSRTPCNWSDRRGEAFYSSIRLQGRACHVFGGAASESDWHGELERWLLALPKPVGVFAANDMTACIVHEILTHNHIAIPGEASLLGVDNVVDRCESVVPNISSIACDFEQGGWECADLLLERIANPRIKKAVRKYHSLGVIHRSSSRWRRGYSQQVLAAVNTIRARACGNITVDDIAASMNCSRRVAEIRFKRETGGTIKDSITTVRLERAKVLLRDRSLSASSISRMCGYGTENTLRIAFKKRFGITLRQGRDGKNQQSVTSSGLCGFGRSQPRSRS